LLTYRIYSETFFKITATFKKMLVQEKARQLKAYEKQEKLLKDMKASGKSTKQAVRDD